MFVFQALYEIEIYTYLHLYIEKNHVLNQTDIPEVTLEEIYYDIELCYLLVSNTNLSFPPKLVVFFI